MILNEEPKSDSAIPRINLVVVLLAPVLVVYFCGTLISTKHLPLEDALRLPQFGLFFSSGGPLFFLVPALVLGIVGIVERKMWKVVVSTSVLSFFLIAVYWILNNLRYG